MAQDQFEEEPKPARSGGRLVTAGVVGACALGVGLGLWARPQAVEQGAKAATVEAEAPAERAPTRMMRIVVDDTPAPVGQPLEVLPAEAPMGQATPAVARELLPAPPVTIEQIVPRRPPSGLMKVVSADPPEPIVVPREPPRAKPPVAARTKPAARAETPRKAKPVVKAEAPRKKDLRVARADPPKAKRAEPRRTETAAAKPKSQNRLAALVRAVRHAPAKLKEEVRTAERRKSKGETERLADAKKAKAERTKKSPIVQAEATPKRAKPVPRGEGPMRVARANTCASSDPGEALVCADPRLSVRERQLQRAYRDAEAAGVPASELARQQRRWLAARAAAAREAPWAVEEVYEARIAELNDQSRRN